tara:strand:- start:2102 stop:2614 length:513 start_codon:yes stop_codon:yes gene_type:complete
MSVSQLFSIPILETEVDLNQIILGDGDEYYNGEVNWTYGKQQCPESTYNYLYGIVSPFLLEYDPYINFQFTDIWRNRYVATDYQGYHIHAQSQWSFIIYETVDSKTVLYNPAWLLIQNHMGVSKSMPCIHNIKLSAGSMVVFPSFIAHHVNNGNEGTTISGNIKLQYNGM